jgi:membrane protease YdiL (CAAX protease family)
VTRWGAFVGLTAIVVSLLLVLARLSQTLVRDAHVHSGGQRSRPSSARHASSNPVIPRIEPPVATGATGHDPTEFELTTGALLANVALTQGVFGGLLAAGAFYFQVPLARLGVDGTPLSTGALGLAVGVAFGLLLWLGNESAGHLAEAAGVGYDESLREMLAPESTSGWVVLLGAVFPTIAFVEEFIFRAAAVGALSAGLGASPWILAIVSSLAFGVAHGAQGRTGIVVTGALGFALAAGFVLTESLLVVVVAHYLVNALEMVVHEGLGVGRGSEHV